jgi:hypothetical protein
VTAAKVGDRIEGLVTAVDGAIEPGYVLAGQRPAEPELLAVGQMPHQAEQRQVGRRHRLSRHGSRVQPFAL